MTIDYADTITANNTTVTIPEDVIVVDDSVYLNNTASMIKSTSKVHYTHPIIGMWAKPSCGCRYSYTWHYKEYVNYCPNCRHYGTLRKNPKGVPEREYTCYRCSSDFCGCCGKEKYSWSRRYLTKA